MSRRLDINAMDRRARTAGYADGLLELFAATVLLVLAGAWMVNPGFVGIAAAFIVLFGWRAVERVKERITYPRIGYYRERVDEQRPATRGMLLYIIGAFVVMTMAVWLTGGFTEAAEWRRAAPLVSGITLAAGFWYAADQSGLASHRWIAAMSLLGGIGAWWFGSGESYAGVVWHLVGLAVPLALLGAWALARFVRSRPMPVRQIDG